MADRLEMLYRSVERCENDHERAADRALRINDDRQAARLPAGSLGKLPQSDEIQASFDQAYANAGESLRDIAKALRSTSERLKMTRTEISELDGLVAELFDKMVSKS